MLIPSVHKIEQELVALQSHCTELDTANRAWELFYKDQINLLKDTLKDYVNFDDDSQGFDQIIQLVVEQFQEEERIKQNIQLGKYITYIFKLCSKNIYTNTGIILASSENINV